MTHYRIGILTALLAAAPAAAVQYDVNQRLTTASPVAPDALSQARAAALRGDAAEALSRYLRVLASTPDNVAALIGAGHAALDVGDTNAAAGFYARADALEPRNAQVKAGLAETELGKGNARAALRLYDTALGLGIAPAEIASDRGLAYDLRGSPRRAQEEYALALQAHPGDPEVTRRLALSQAIAGDRVAAMATLDPLLRRQDVPAWRARAFVFALTGDPVQAVSGAALVMPKDQVDALAPYLARLTTLRPQDKAAAIHLGRFPGEGAPPTQTAGTASPRPAVPRLPIDRATLTAAPPLVVPPPAAPSVPVAASSPDPAIEAAAANARRVEVARAQRQTRVQQLAEARAKREAAEEAARHAIEKKNPARHWVQVAGGANKRDLGRAWDALKDKWPKLLAGRSPWTLHYRYTNRLMIGPFPSSDAAQDWVGDARAKGFSTFRVETNAGDPVERVGG